MITKRCNFILSEEQFNELKKVGFGNATTGIKLLLSLYAKEETKAKEENEDSK